MIFIKKILLGISCAATAGLISFLFTNKGRDNTSITTVQNHEKKSISFKYFYELLDQIQDTGFADTTEIREDFLKLENKSLELEKRLEDSYKKLDAIFFPNLGLNWGEIRKATGKNKMTPEYINELMGLTPEIIVEATEIAKTDDEMKKLLEDFYKVDEIFRQTTKDLEKEILEEEIADRKLKKTLLELIESQRELVEVRKKLENIETKNEEFENINKQLQELDKNYTGTKEQEEEANRLINLYSKTIKDEYAALLEKEKLIDHELEKENQFAQILEQQNKEITERLKKLGVKFAD